ncbi:hypothetical protein VE00_08783 [Pseudogymnoascus sp. WSF 3629]|nr:hypothetical protein VE00_08783 [Pseudogymnoascus sp. WSF 3629]
MADGLDAPFEGRPGDASISEEPLQPGVDMSQDDIADGVMGDILAYPDRLPVLGDLALANSHGIQRFVQPEQAGFSSSHYYAMFSKGSKAALGYTKFEKIASTTSDMKTGLDMVRAGGILLLVVWLGIVVTVAVSFLYPRDFRGEKQLIRGVAVAIFALVIRILYTTLSAFINTASFNLRTGGTITEKVVLDLLPEFIFTCALLAAGIASRNLNYEREMK